MDIPHIIPYVLYPSSQSIRKRRSNVKPVKRERRPNLRYLNNQHLSEQRALERLYADLVGPICPVPPGKQYRYLLIVMDDYSRYLACKALQRKRDAGEVLIEIINQIKAATDLRVNQGQADWGGEFRNTDLEKELF